MVFLLFRASSQYTKLKTYIRSKNARRASSAVLKNNLQDDECLVLCPQSRYIYITGGDSIFFLKFPNLFLFKKISENTMYGVFVFGTQKQPQRTHVSLFVLNQDIYIPMTGGEFIFSLTIINLFIFKSARLKSHVWRFCVWYSKT